MMLTLECPISGGNPVFCPLHEVRTLDLWHRIKWVSGLASEHLIYLAAYHPVCARWQSEDRPVEGRS